MIDKLNEHFAYGQEALSLRHQRQEILSANMANADTPGYKARDIEFGVELKRALGPGDSHGAGLQLQATSERHLPGQAGGTRMMQDLLYRIPDQPSLDGNTVEIERERAQFTDNAVRYDTSLSLMGGSIAGLRKAMQSE